MQLVGIHFIEVASFLDFARFVCALREYPLRVYAHKYQRKMVFVTRIVLSESILSFYTSDYSDGRYISYDFKNGKEIARVVDSLKSTSLHAPIVHLESIPFSTKTPKKIMNKFKTAKIKDLGDLARLTYDPEWPDEQKITLVSFPHKKKWVIGYVTDIELDDVVYCFNYVELDDAPDKPFVKYSGHHGVTAEFTATFQHGFPNLPIIKLKKSHPIFGLK